MSITNRVALEKALTALRAERREYEPYVEVIYGDWESEDDAADRYAVLTEAIRRIEDMLKE